MRYYLADVFIWIAKFFYKVHVKLDNYTSWILDTEENLFTYEEIEARIDNAIIEQMENQL